LLDCRVKGDRVHVEAFYDDTPAQQAKIFVENERKQIVAEGRTDERGLWSCPLPMPGNYTVRAESVGHATRETLVVPKQAKKENPDLNKEKIEPKKDKKDAEGMPKDVGRDNPSGSFVPSSDTNNDRSQRKQSTRAEKTETPWLKFGIGFAVIAALCAGALLLRKRQAPRPLD
jgi:hypothetical protein